MTPVCSLQLDLSKPFVKIKTKYLPMVANIVKIKRIIRLETETKSILQVLIESIQKHLLKMSQRVSYPMERSKYYFIKSRP